MRSIATDPGVRQERWYGMSRKMVLALSCAGVFLALFPLACAVPPKAPVAEVPVSEGDRAGTRDAGPGPSRVDDVSARKPAIVIEPKRPGRISEDRQPQPNVDQEEAKPKAEERIDEGSAAPGEERRDGGVKEAARTGSSSASDQRPATAYGSPELDARMFGRRVPRGVLGLALVIHGIGPPVIPPGEFIEGATVRLSVRLKNGEALSMERQRSLRGRRADYLVKRKELSKEDARRAVGLDKLGSEELKPLKVGKGPLGWLENLQISVYRLSEDSPRAQEHVADIHTMKAALLEAASQKGSFIKTMLESEWSFDTRGWRPGNYLVTAVFEVKADEVRDPDMWRGRADAKKKFSLVTQERASEHTIARSAYLKALRALKDRRYDDCIKHAKESAALRSKYLYLEPFVVLGQAYEAKGDPESAIRVYEEAVRLSGGRRGFLLLTIKKRLRDLRAAGGTTGGTP